MALSEAAAEMSDLIRYRYNTMAAETPGGEWCWRVILEKGGGYEEILVKHLVVRVPSFSKADEMPVVGRKYHMACYGRLRVEDGVGIIDAVEQAADAAGKLIVESAPHNK